jgi:elongation factor Ts
MAISVTDIQKLRQMTGAGMMKAKEALEEANGDMTKAQEILRVKGMASADKKSDRAASAGMIGSYVPLDDPHWSIISLHNLDEFLDQSGQKIKITSKIIE